jgi:UDP-arabinose 4-epimerase
METVLVTGGAGYIGSHTCKALAQAGYTPVTVDDLSAGHRRAVRWGPLVEGDVADRRLMASVLREYRAEAVLHFASHASVSESMHRPARYLYGNVAGALALLEAMAECGVRRMVFSSTCAIYGIPRETPITEASAPAPINPYGESKLYIEQSLRWYQRIHGISWAALRYFNAAGADAEAEIGESHDPETHVIPLAIQAALGQRPDFRIMGTDYPTPDGTALRDYVHVSDLAEAHLLALAHLKDGGESGAFNLGAGRPYSVREVIGAVERATGRTAPAVEAPRRPGDPPCLYADCERARRELRWTPRYATLDAIVESAVRWHSGAGLEAAAGNLEAAGRPATRE